MCRILFPLIVAALYLLNSKTDVVAAEKETIFSVAKVNGRTKMIACRRYHLVAVRFDPLPLLSISGSRASFWIVDGEFGKTRMRPVKPQDAPKGALPLGVELSWMRLPVGGKVEVVFGVTTVEPKATADEVRKQLLREGHKPFITDVRMLPVVKAEIAKELSQQLQIIGKRDLRKKP